MIVIIGYLDVGDFCNNLFHTKTTPMTEMSAHLPPNWQRVDDPSGGAVRVPSNTSAIVPAPSCSPASAAALLPIVAASTHLG